MGLYAVRGEQQIKFSGMLAVAAERALGHRNFDYQVTFTPAQAIRLVAEMLKAINECPLMWGVSPYQIQMRIMDLQKLAFVIDHLNDPDSDENLVFV